MADSRATEEILGRNYLARFSQKTHPDSFKTDEIPPDAYISELSLLHSFCLPISQIIPDVSGAAILLETHFQLQPVDRQS